MNQEDNHYIRSVEALKDAIIFKNLKIEILHAILLRMSRESWTKGTVKQPQITAPLYFHFILSGKIKIYLCNPNNGREYTLYLLTKGDVFDILSLLDAQAHQVYIEALEPVELLKVPIDQMRTWLNTYPVLNGNMMLYLGKRMRSLEENIFDITSNSTLVRLSRLILNNINVQSKKLESINNLSNEEIANLIGTTRPVLNRHIQELKQSGAISVKRKEIQIKNLRVLLESACQQQL